MMPKSTRLPYERVEYLNNVLDYDIYIFISIRSGFPFSERQVETQVLGLFNIMKALDDRKLGLQ